ncbi:TrmH family RNA methyltransferase [Neisseria sp.]|uniref:TrmH family RNA methyltransferase n=1 Tax=Neisseria sp. TaxID=192066 RepID=UPI0035A13415
MKYIASAHNEQIKHLAKLLSQAKARRLHGQAVLEGVHLVQAYMQVGGMPEQLYLPESRADNTELKALIAQMPSEKNTVVGSSALAKITSLNDADDVMALIQLPSAPKLPQQGDCVILDGVQDPGNVGTILRSAAAAGVKTLVLGTNCADAWSPKVLRAGMGAHFLLDICTQADLLEWRAGFADKVYATTLGGKAESLYRLNLTEPAAWVFGSEGSGVSIAMQEQADRKVYIPMAGETESLNVAMAATVCLFEQMRQRI